MRRALASLFDVRRISGQLGLLVVMSVLLSHLLITGLFFFMRGPPPGNGGVRAVYDRFATLVRVLDVTPDPVSRTALVDGTRQAFPDLGLVLAPADASDPPPGTPLDRHALPPGLFGPDRDVRVLGVVGPAGRQVRVAARLDDATQVHATLPAGPDRPPEFSGFIVATVGVTLISMAVLLVWAARGLTSPLTSFAGAAEQFSLEGDTLLLPETGPTEIRTASRAFNRMQQRIRRMMADRTRMLASVSHDLRTPITRLRLRAEFMEDDVARSAMFRDLDQMNAMIHGALSYLRDGQHAATPAGKVDMAALLRTVADEFVDLGHDVVYEGPDHQVLEGRPDDLQRAVTNLVENAVKFGDRSVVRLAVFPGVAEVEVSDDGPGIPEGRRDAMLEPFARGDDARAMSGGAGFGLGLSIVRKIVEDHGGRLVLLDGAAAGLTARLTLPLAPAL